MNKYLEIGQIVNTRGLKGEVKVNSYSEDPERFEKIKNIIIVKNGNQFEYKIQKVTYTKNQVILKDWQIKAKKYRYNWRSRKIKEFHYFSW